MEKDKARVFDLHFLNGSFRVQLVSETAFIKNEETIRVSEVFKLTDDEKRRIKKLRNMNTTESEAFLLDLLERAGVL